MLVIVTLMRLPAPIPAGDLTMNFSAFPTSIPPVQVRLKSSVAPSLTLTRAFPAPS